MDTQYKLCKTPNCGLKNINEFYHDRTKIDRRASYCGTCERERKKRTYKLTESRKAKNRNTYLKCKSEVMSNYGGVCQCCGESRLAFLTLDHINQNGAEYRKRMSPTNTCTGYNFYVWLRQNNWPDLGLQVLCANCNTAKGSCGECPHVKEKQFPEWVI